MYDTDDAWQKKPFAPSVDSPQNGDLLAIFGVYDGHQGGKTSAFLRDHLHMQTMKYLVKNHILDPPMDDPYSNQSSRRNSRDSLSSQASEHSDEQRRDANFDVLPGANIPDATSATNGDEDTKVNSSVPASSMVNPLKIMSPSPYSLKTPQSS